MLSPFDIANLDDLIKNKDDRFDWFTAQLMQFMSRCELDIIMEHFVKGFPVESEVILHWQAKQDAIKFWTAEEMAVGLHYLHGKADYMNRPRLPVSL